MELAKAGLKAATISHPRWLPHHLGPSERVDQRTGSGHSITYPSGATSTATYNAGQEQTGSTQTGPSGTIASDSYTYDAAANQTRDTSLTGTTSYSYDALNRLTGAGYPNGPT